MVLRPVSSHGIEQDVPYMNMVGINVKSPDRPVVLDSDYLVVVVHIGSEAMTLAAVGAGEVRGWACVLQKMITVFIPTKSCA